MVRGIICAEVRPSLLCGLQCLDAFLSLYAGGDLEVCVDRTLRLRYDVVLTYEGRGNYILISLDYAELANVDLQ